MGKPEDYREDEYIHFLERKSGKKVMVAQKNGRVRELPESEMHEIKFEDVLKINLSKNTNSISSLTDNAWKMDRYMSYYWSVIMDRDCIFLYYHLLDYCRISEGVDICYPPMSELREKMNLSKPTLVSKLKKLEDNNFILRIRRLEKAKDNREVSPIYKVRATIPHISKEQYDILPRTLQKKHDKYMASFANDTQMDWFASSGRKNIDDIINNVGDRMVSSKTRKEIKKSIASAEAETYIMENLPSKMKDTMKNADEFQTILIENKWFTKPSAEMIFNNTITVYDKSTFTAYLIVKDKTQKSFLEEGLSEDQFDRMNQCLIDMYDSIYHVRYFTREQFVVTVMKGK